MTDLALGKDCACVDVQMIVGHINYRSNDHLR